MEWKMLLVFLGFFILFFSLSFLCSVERGRGVKISLQTISWLFLRETAHEFVAFVAVWPLWRLPSAWRSRRFCCDLAKELALDPVGSLESRRP
jgi:hypothetical protein